MESLTRINDVFYFRLRIPKDVSRYFPRHEIVKSTRAKRYSQAKAIVRGLLGKAEELFMVIRSKCLDDAAVFKIVRDFVESTMELKYDRMEELMASPDRYDQMCKVYSYAQESIQTAVRTRGEVEGWHTMGFTGVGADYLCQSAGYNVEEESPQYKKLVHQLAIAKRDIIATLQERLDAGDSAYDAEQRKKQTKVQEERSKSNTLSELIAAYCRSKGKVTGKGRKGKVAEKMEKIIECFEVETGKKNILLADIDYPLTKRVGERLAQYPLYRNVRHKGLTLDQIAKLDDVEVSSETTTREELSRLSGLYEYALTRLDGLKKNYAKGLSEEVVGKAKGKASDARDIFRPADISEIIRVLGVFKNIGTINRKAKVKGPGEFEKNPHLLFITLIGLYSGARVNEICQLKVSDIIMVDGIWCFNHAEESEDKSLKTANSIRTNPIHPTLIDFGLIRFRDSQAAKGYAGLWEGSANHRCDFYEKSGNCSHYVSKWWNGTFKAKMNLSNPVKQSFHSTRHTFINWFRQNIRGLDYEARNALSGHLDKDDIAALELQGYDADAESEVTYSKGLNVKRQMELLKKLDYGIDLTPLRVI